MKKSWLLSMYLLLFICSSSNGAIVDSLKSLLNKTNISDSLSCAVMNELSYELHDEDVDQALYYAQKAYEKAINLRNPFLTMRSLGQMGNAYMQQRKNLMAIECFIKSSKYAEKLSDSARISAINHNICILYTRIQKNSLARKYLTISLKFMPHDTDPEQVAVSKILLGSLFYAEKKYDEALKIFYEAQKLYERCSNPNRVAHALMNVGIVKVDLGELNEAVKYLVLAHEKFILLKEKGRAGQALFRLADAYLRMKKYDKAFAYHEQAMRFIDYQLTSGNDFEIKKYLERIGKAYMDAGNVTKANEAFNKALTLYHIALQNVDSIIDSEREQAFADVAIKYDTEKTERENKIQKLSLEKQDADIKQQKLYVIFGVCGAILMTCLVFLFWRSYHITKKSNRKIEAQKNQIELQRDEIQTKNHEITSSIEYAKSLQAAILPFDHVIRKALPNSFVLWLPRDIVSGDFYWFYEKEDIVYFAVADCTGHGVPGAFVSMTCHNILNQVVIDKGITDPGQALSAVNNQVCSVFKFDESGMKAQDGMDVVFCKIDKKKNAIEFAGALNPLLLVRKGEPLEFKTDKFPIGGRTPEGFAFTTHKLELNEGDWVYLFSDGYKDQFGGDRGKKIRSGNFIKLLTACSTMPAVRQREYLLEFLDKWQGGFERVDDVLVSGFQLK